MAKIVNEAVTRTTVDGQEAARQLTVLEQKAKKYREQIEAANKAGDVVSFNKATKELSKVEAESKKVLRSSMDIDAVLKNLSTSGPKQVTAAIKQLNSEINSGKIARGSKEWDSHLEKLRLLLGEQEKIRAEMSMTTKTQGQASFSFLSSISDTESALKSALGINNQFGNSLFALSRSGAGVPTILSAIGAGAKALGQTLLTLMANPVFLAIAGIGGVAMAYKWYYDYNMGLVEATRLTKAFTGKSGDDMKAYRSEVQAVADTFNVNFKDMLQSVTILAKTYGITHEEALKKVKDGYLVGANIQGNYLDQLRQYAPIFKNLGVSTDKFIGLLASVNKSGLDSEKVLNAFKMADGRIRTMNASISTALDNIGINSKQLEKDLASGAKSTYDAILMVSEKLKELPDNSSAAGQAIRAIFGREGATIGVGLLQNIGQINGNLEEMKAKSGELAKLRDEHIRQQTRINQLMASFFDDTGGKFEVFIAKWKYFKDDILVKILEGFATLNNTTQNTPKYRQMMEQKVTESEGEYSFKLRSGIEKIPYPSLDPLKKDTKESIALRKKAQDNYNAIVKLNYEKEQKSLELLINQAVWYQNKAQKNFNQLSAKKKDFDWLDPYGAHLQDKIDISQKNLDKAKAKVDFLNARMTGLNKAYQPYIDSQESTKNNNNNNSNKNKKSAETLQREAMNKELVKLQIEYNEKFTSLNKQYLDGEISSKSELESNLTELTDKYNKDQIAKLTSLKITEEKVNQERSKKISEIQKDMTDKAIQHRDELLKIILDADPAKAEEMQYEERLRKLGIFGKLKENMSKDEQQAAEALAKQHQERMAKIENPEATKKVKQLDVEMSAEMTDLSKNKALLSEKNYKNSMLVIELAYTAKKLQIDGLNADQRIALEQKTNQILQQINEQNSDLVSTNSKKKQEITLEEQKQKELDFLDILFPEKLRGEEAYQEARMAIIQRYNLLELQKDQDKRDKMKKYASFTLDSMTSLLSAYSSYVSAANDAETAKINAKYDKEVEAAGNNQTRIDKINKKRDAELKKTEKKNTEKSYNLQIAMAFAQTAVSALAAYSSTAAIPIIGPGLAPIAAGVATAAGLLNVLAVKKQKEAAMAQYWTGGYTSDGGKYDVRGYVHAREFVGNSDSTANPTVRRVYDVIDQAQRTNTVSSLKPSDFAKVLEYRERVAGISSSAANNSIGSSSAQAMQTSEELVATIVRLAETQDRLTKRLDEGIEGKVYMTGQNGIVEQTKLYNQIKNEASR